MRYLIIGNGVAGSEAAQEIRKNDGDGDITILTQSTHHYYYRPRLVEYLAGTVALDGFTLYRKDRYEKQDITVRTGMEVVSIDRNAKTVTATGDEKIGYDRLLLATGADPFVPPFPGNDLDGVFTIRGVDDCDRLLAHCRPSGTVTVVGGGLLGLEIAHSLIRRGQVVTIVEVAERLLPRQLDSEGGALLRELLEAKDFRFILGDTVAGIEPAGAELSVRLKSGNVLSAGAVVLSAGIRGRTGLARTAGIAVDRGIIVNDQLQTSDPDIFAAGDPVEHNGRLYGIWPAAREQGMLAGRAMSGERVSYAGTPFTTRLKVTGIHVYSAGDPEGDGTVHTVRKDGIYKKCIVAEDRLTGALAVGDDTAADIFQKIFSGALPLEEITTALATQQGGIMDKYECSACGYIYDPEKGDDAAGIAPGTAFEDLPDDWVCPVCGVGKDMFNKVD